MQENPWVTERAAKKQLTSCSLWQMSPGRFLHLVLPPPTLSTSVTHPSHPTLSVLLSWERAARGDPGLLNLLPKTLLLKWVCLCACVYLFLFIRINSQYLSERLYLRMQMALLHFDTRRSFTLTAMSVWGNIKCVMERTCSELFSPMMTCE